MEYLGKTLLVGLGGALGANARYWLGGWLAVRWGVWFPWATLAVNLSGSLLIGLFMGLALREAWAPSWRLFVAIGILGGYTTFSTFSYETVVLLQEREYIPALWNAAGSCAGSVLATWIGLVAARAMAGGNG